MITNLSSYHSGGGEFWNQFHWTKVKMSGGLGHSGGLRKESVPLHFHLPKAACITLPVDPSWCLHFFLSHFLLWLWPSCEPFKSTLWFHWTHQDNLQQSHLKIPNLITTAKFLRFQRWVMDIPGGPLFSLPQSSILTHLCHPKLMVPPST